MSVILSSHAPRPGDTLRIEVDGVAPGRALALVWNRRRYRLYPVGPNAQRALLGVPLGMDAGSVPIHFVPWRASSKARDLPPDQALSVSSRTYETEDVVFPKDKSKLLRGDREAREDAICHRAFRRLRSEQYWEGRFDPPVDGPREGAFGVRRLRNHTIVAGFHRGMDFRAAANTPVRASNNGIVALARHFRVLGRTVIIDHGQGVMTLYLHMSALKVAPGQRVKKGDVIGRVGSSGISTGPHVHWGVYVHGVSVDPAPWLEQEF